MGRRINGITIFFILLTFLSINVTAQQITIPRVSPKSSVIQRVGLTDIQIDYSRPSVRGREVWGNIVPMGLTAGVAFGSGNDFPWRAGANENTVINFSTDVKVNGKKIKAGSYGLHMIPGEKEWVVVFTKTTTAWGSFHYDKNDDVLRVKTKPQKAEFTEWLAYDFNNLSINGATVNLRWEKLKVSFDVETNTNEIVLSSINDQLKSVAGFSWQSYQQAAFYCLQNNINLVQGEQWVQRSITMNENANNRNLLGYLLMANNKQQEAMKIFNENVEKYPTNWNVFDSLGENLNVMGNKNDAIKNYKLALDKAPAGQKPRIEGIIKNIEAGE